MSLSTARDTKPAICSKTECLSPMSSAGAARVETSNATSSKARRGQCPGAAVPDAIPDGV